MVLSDTGLRAQWLLGGGLEAQLLEDARRSEGADGLEEAGQGKERSTRTPANDGGVWGQRLGEGGPRAGGDCCPPRKIGMCSGS